MRSSTVLRLSLPAALCAVGFCASEVWNSKDSKEWTADDVNKILTESPWAKDTKIESGATGQQQQRRGMGRGGGMGGGGMGGGGIGFPGSGGGMGRGGGGYPGGQYPNGGGQYPNGGGQYPNGGGQYPDSGGNYPNGGQGGGRVNLPATVLVRWQSAKVVQTALAKQDAPSAGTAAAAPAPAEAAPAAPAENRYVISVFGLQAPHRRNPDDDQDSTSISSRQGDAERTKEQDRFREQLLDSAKLMLKRGAIIAVDVKFVEGVGSHEIQFFFPRSNDPISLDDKDVTFDVKIGRAKLEHKFHLKDMTVKGRLDL